jgi:hypothetical protein
MDDADENPPAMGDAEEDRMLPDKVLDPGVQTQIFDEQGADPGEHDANPQEAQGQPEGGNDRQREGGNVRQPADVNPISIVEDMYPGAAAVVASTHSAFHTLYDKQIQIGKGNVHYPFAGHTEWELARWLHKTGISRARIDEFLKLDYVSTIYQWGCYNL